MPPTESDSGKIIRTVFRAANVLEARKPNPPRALEILSPYMNLESIEDMPIEKSNNLLHLVCSIVGDAHREADSPSLAADWYRRASEFRRDGGYIQLYVDTVIEHRLDTHYEHALVCWRDAKQAWSQTSIILRAICHVCAFCLRIKRPWCLKPYRELQRRAKEFESVLVSRIEEQGRASEFN